MSVEAWSHAPTYLQVAALERPPFGSTESFSESNSGSKNFHTHSQPVCFDAESPALHSFDFRPCCMIHCQIGKKASYSNQS
jgi:hypothetical protein